MKCPRPCSTILHIKNYTTTKGTTRVPETSHLWAGNHSESIKKEKAGKKNNVDQQACPWSQHHKNCTSEHPRPVSSLLKGLIRRNNNEKTKLSNAATENRAYKPTSWIGITPSECSLYFKWVFLPYTHAKWVLHTRQVRQVMLIHDVGLQALFSVAALLNLVFSLLFRLMSPLSKDETGRGGSPVQFLWCCDHGHSCWSVDNILCFFLFFPYSPYPQK